MKAVILAGGFGTRLSEETNFKPKPMIEIGGRPFLWHIMKIYAAHGVNDFIICCGYKGYVIKEYFANYLLHMADVTIDMRQNQTIVHNHEAEPWRVTLVDTGENTNTGGRLRRVASHLVGEEAFCFTYGDGLADVDIGALINFHRSHGHLATVTAVTPPGLYGSLQCADTTVTQFVEKPRDDGRLVNGGYFVLSPRVIDYIADDNTGWETEVLPRLVSENALEAFTHRGFWRSMDTLREKTLLEELWANGEAPWKMWA